MLLILLSTINICYELVYQIYASNMIEFREKVIWFGWRKEKGLAMTEKRFFLGKVVLGETLSVIEDESSACRRQDGAIEIQEERGQ